MLARFMAFFVWGLLAFACVFWLQRMLASPLGAPATTLLASDRPSTRVDLSRLLGAAPAAAPEAVAPAESRYRLVGLVAPKAGVSGHESEGVALLSIDGGAPRTVRVGALVDADVRLVALAGASAWLAADGQPRFQLQLAPAAAPATGTLPVAAPAPGVQPGQGFAPTANVAATPMPQVMPQVMPGQVSPALPPPQGQTMVPQRQ